MVDLTELRSMIDAAPEAMDVAAGVTRRWLEEVERELRQGRAARAQLAGQNMIAAAIDSIHSEARA